MHILKVNLKKRSYHILVGKNIIKQLARYLSGLNIGKSAYIITNTAIKAKYGRVLGKILEKSGFEIKFKLVPDSEKSKSIETASKIIRDIALYDRNKRIFIIAFGGGVIGDLAGFIASIYKRGTNYIQIPTTLLAQVDSSIGGKTAVDLRQGKNLIGVFYQPRLIFSDVAFLKTLQIRQVRSGLAEVIKYGIIKDPHLFSYLEKKYKDILALEINALEFIVKRCAAIKAKIVAQDEREERGLRTILNFGHTLGHAIEAACAYKGYNHGETIALGMLLAAKMSLKRKMINSEILQRIEALLRIMGLPTRIRKVSLDKIIAAHYYDKKFSGSKNKFVLIAGIGKTKIIENLPLALIKEALAESV